MPWAIALALTFTYVVGWLFNIVLAFCMGEPTEILVSPIAQPVAQIFFNVMGKRPAIFFTVAAFVVMNFVCITALQAGSRTIWAFSRDEMIPGYKLWYKIWRRTDTPVLAVWLYTLICILINLIGLGSYVTIAAIFNTCAIALDWSYCIPILCKLFFGRFRRGPWHLGRASVFVNVWACIWTAFVSVIFLFPTFMPVAADTVRCKQHMHHHLPPSGPKTQTEKRGGRKKEANPRVLDELRRRDPGLCVPPGHGLLVPPGPQILHGAPDPSPRRRRPHHPRRQRRAGRSGEGRGRFPSQRGAGREAGMRAESSY